MSNLSLTATKRIKKTKGEVGTLPSVVYGRHLESLPITINTAAFKKLFDEAGEATIFTLSVDGEDHDVLVHDFQRDPVSYEVSHVDFYAIEKGQKITVSVPLEFIGIAPVEDNDGQVIKVLHELEVECEPKDLPSHIDVDMTVLQNIGDSIHVSDLKLADGVDPKLDPEEVVVTTSEVKAVEEVEEESDTEIDLSAITVEGESKDEEAEEDSTE